ncbi:MAG TPA: signal peptide peptidase SppA [Flavitalea sp.]|nr:signal peptide peptidase SppA [Flavitalea sp.]
MNSFLKIFLACIAALFAFTLLTFFMLFGLVSGLAVPEKTKTGANAVLVIDLSQHFPEIEQRNFLASFSSADEYDVPSVYNVVRLIRHAKNDPDIKGIYLQCENNGNGFAASEEIRNALNDFRGSRRFIIAYGDVIGQDAYRVANVANKVYCNPKGGLEWRGFGVTMAFVKGTLEKLEIQPQIFYAGKFKSATEPFREKQMTDANRLQTSELLGDLYDQFLIQTSKARGIDTASLRRLANQNTIQFANDALQAKLVDGLYYDDQVKEEIRNLVGASQLDAVNYIPVGKYARAVSYKESGAKDIAVIYAEGDIIDGKGQKGQIGSEEYRRMIRRVRLDKNIHAIVLRINSGGGSSLASENIWRELTLARKEKPVVVSFGDVAASGAYYVSCNADTIFTQPNTITGSIGVFALIPNLQKFFNNKLGVTFDEVNTGPESAQLTVTRPLTDMQKRFIQAQVDTIYHDFKSRVAEGRKISMEFTDSIGQGRVWSGNRAIKIGLADRLGGLKDALDCAARMAKISDYSVKEYPGQRGFLEEFLNNYKNVSHVNLLKQHLNAEQLQTLTIMERIKQMTGTIQSRIPFDLIFR